VSELGLVVDWFACGRGLVVDWFACGQGLVVDWFACGNETSFSIKWRDFVTCIGFCRTTVAVR